MGSTWESLSQMALRYLDLDALKAAPLTKQPFQYLVVPGFVRPEACAEINRDYPKIAESGSFPVAQLSYGANFRELLDEMASDEFRKAFEDKFGLDLAGRPHTDHGSRPLQPQGRPHPHGHEEQDHHDPDLHEPGMGACGRATQAAEIVLEPRRSDYGGSAGRGHDRWPSSGPRIPGTGTSRSPASVASSSSTGSRPKATAASPCCAIMSRRRSSACSARPTGPPPDCRLRRAGSPKADDRRRRFRRPPGRG